jgi:hypothetical protein
VAASLEQGIPFRLGVAEKTLEEVHLATAEILRLGR